MLSETFIVVYVNEITRAIRYAAALGGIAFEQQKITVDKLHDFEKKISNDLEKRKKNYLMTEFNRKIYVLVWGCEDNKYTMDYKSCEGDKQFELIKQLFTSEKCELIINGTDYSYENEMIFNNLWHSTNKSGRARSYKRLRLKELTEKRIRKAFEDNNLMDLDKYEVFQLTARLRTEIKNIIFSSIMNALSYVDTKQNLSFPGLLGSYIIFQVSQNKSDKGISSRYYTIKGNLKTSEGKTFECMLKNNSQLTKEDAYKKINSIKKKGYISKVNIDTETLSAPFPYNQYTLFKDAISNYNISLCDLDNTIKYLYKQGLITYPYTNATFMNYDDYFDIKDRFSAARSIPIYDKLISVAEPLSIPKMYMKKNKDPHGPILITDYHINSKSDFSNDKDINRIQKRVYDMIVRRIISLAYPVDKSDYIEINSIFSENHFISNIDVSSGQSWKSLVKKDNSNNSYIKKLAEGSEVYGEFEVTPVESLTLNRLSESSLVENIYNATGNNDQNVTLTVSEISKVISDLIVNGLIKIENGYILPAKNSLLFFDIFSKVEDFKSLDLIFKYDLELKRISELSDIYSAAESGDKLKEEIKQDSEKWSSQIIENYAAKYIGTPTQYVCPICMSKLCENSTEYHCICGFIIKKLIMGKNIDDKNVEHLVTKNRTPLIKGFISDNGTTFNAYLYIDEENKKVKLTENSIFKCPVCKQPLKPKDDSYVCSAYNEKELDPCHFFIKTLIYGKKIKSSQILKITEEGESDLITGFVNDNKKFNGVVYIDDGKVKVKKINN